jgi:outer membrane protein assembly factor BamB
LLSFRLSSTVVIVNARTGQPRWRWGADVLSHQHHASWLENGHILLFDNGCHRREHPSFSQVLEVDPKTKKVEWSYQSEMILGMFSFMVSGCERLPNGNTFITEGASGHLLEVTADGETVWEYVSPWALTHPRFGVTTAVFRAYRIAADDPRLAGLPRSPAPFAALNDRILAGKTLGLDDEPGAKPKRRRATKKTVAKKTVAKKAVARKAPAKKRAR